MEEYEEQSGAVDTAKLLHDLQEQLFKYKTSLETLQNSTEATEHVAEELAKLNASFEELNRSQSGLKQRLNETHRILFQTQQKAEEVGKDLGRLTESFVANFEHILQEKSLQFEKKFEKAFLYYHHTIGREIRRLKYVLVGNVGLVLILFFAILFFTDDSPPVTDAATAKSGDSPIVENNQPVNRKAVQKIGIQILNGCGVRGVAQEFESFLEKNNFRVENVDNADNFDYAFTLFYVNDPSFPQNMVAASALGIDSTRILTAPQKFSDYDITIIIGADYVNFLPKQ